MAAQHPDDGPRVCPECGKRFVYIRAGRPGAAPLFCTPEHKKAYFNRDNSLATHIILAKAWRQGRHKKGGDAVAKYAFAEFCIAIDAANAADKAAGRLPALEVLRARYKRQGIGS